MKINQTVVIALCTFVLLGCTVNAQNQTQGIKKNDQQLLIVTKEDGCIDKVALFSAIDNCQGSDFDRSCGINGKDCVCMQPGKFVSWRTDNQSRFEIQFVAQNPMKDNCPFTQPDGLTIKSENKKQIKCKVETTGDYEYNVILESCPEQTYDPRVVIRGHR